MKSLPWRKVLARSPSAWDRLPLMARGLASELLRHVDEYGRIFAGHEDPVEVIWRLLACHRYERRTVRKMFTELVDGGFVVVAEDHFRLATPDVELTFGEPKQSTNGDLTEHLPTTNEQLTDNLPTTYRQLTARRNSESLNCGPGEEKREEKKRINPPNPPLEGGRSSSRSEVLPDHNSIIPSLA